MNITNQIKQEFDLTLEHTTNIIALIDEGNTVPFIARYRKEMTGHIDDQVLRNLLDRLNYLRNLEKRKEEVTKSITEQGKFSDEISLSLANATSLTEVEDIYRPYKQKKKTRATVAISKGLSPLADIIENQDPKGAKIEDIAKDYINEELGVLTVDDAINGAVDIICERISDNAEIRKKLRYFYLKLGVLSTTFAKGVDIESDKAGVYEMYKDFSEPITKLKAHRVLAFDRGESEGILKVTLQIDKEIGIKTCENFCIKGDSPYKKHMLLACEDAFDRLIKPSIEREVRALLTETAQEKAIKTFEINLKPLLMQPPIKGKTVLGFDPGYRTGCKLAVVDKTGKVLDKAVIYPTINSEKKTQEAKVIIKGLIDKYSVDIVSIGNGTASKESEIFVNEVIKDYKGRVSYIVVSEAGASVYSASELGAKEFPDFDVSERSAVSIARRLQDPLAELIKIDPKSIGVGQYQHDLSKQRLDQVLSGVLEDCVNTVGVDLNTASVSLLSHVAGLNKGIAGKIVEYREKNGSFVNRKQLLKVSTLGEKAYTQCAGFLRIVGGENILDNTAVHPESYDGAKKLLKMFNYTDDDIKNLKLSCLKEKVEGVGYDKVCNECGLGRDTVIDIVTEIIKPGRDIRDSLPQPILRSDVMTLEDLKSGMILTGTVRNVTDFGAFVDIGVHQDGLVHLSQISEKFIKHPSDVLTVGEIVKVKVLDVDLKKNRISLTMKGVQ